MWASLKGSRMAWLLVCRWAELFIKEEDTLHQTVDQTNLKEVVKTTKKEEIDAFSSKIVHGQMKTMLLGNNMHVMTQSMKGGDRSHLPHGLSVANMYTEIISGSKWVAVVVKNLMTILITIAKGVKVNQVVAANLVPPVEMPPGNFRGSRWSARYSVD